MNESTERPPCIVATRQRLPDTRVGLNHKFRVGTQEGYLNVGTYPDGRIGEIFVEMQFQGSMVSGLVDAWAICISMLLQSGAHIETLVAKFKGMKFGGGTTGNTQIPEAESIIDYIMRWVEIRFIPNDGTTKL